MGEHMKGALNGSTYVPNLDIVSHDRQRIEIVAEYRGVYTINVFRAFANDFPPAQEIAKVEVHSQNSFEQLKEKVEQQTGIPKCSQRLEFEGCIMLDNYILGRERVFQGCTVVLRVMTGITYIFKAVGGVTVEVDQSLSTVLGRIAANISEDVSMLRFVFTKTSGAVAANARAWLPDRTQLFKAKDVVGSVAENGLGRLVNGDVIQVYRKHLKRAGGQEQ
ncbi:hypothetical protein EDD36DRAFT_210850 [Exophiala viscosa]|uniref:Ubiquitin-like domain-containing protein n=1 Tax=Exophiala viscosa TaxID=2486360 RepID=A0AAN6DYL7_9EURO|nr:hypothetical protein EDD36DRAFT_210850 [Exophiala viscosa]